MIIKILIIAIMALGAGNVAQWVMWNWNVKSLKQKIANLEVEKTQIQVELDKKKVEIEYAPKIKPIQEISKRRTPKVVKPVVIQKEPPPKVNPGEWADAVAVAESINQYWGLRDKPKKPAPGKAANAGVRTAPS